MEETRRLRILVAEDEDLIRNHLVRKINELGEAVNVVGTAQDGKEALGLMQSGQPDLLVTDIRMPVMDGMALIKHMHLYHPRVRNIITSGYADFEYARQAMQYGVTDYLLKPISADELHRVLLRVKEAVDSEESAFRANMQGMHSTGMNTGEIVGSVQRYLREHFRKDVSLEQIARHFNFNASYLSKLFMKHTGELPSRYLMTLRINEAKYLLANHRHLSVKEVGERVGYPDQFYFSRIFKQMTGCTPKDYVNESHKK
ncbi:response regulator transcription factor [Paenibacillus arenilitoris]|uniref:Response regulator n=1 Tax=Paenibacillus arenilitoris TaxID=2772299 RepID=A0A927H8W0_9BACL|nr:response regulator [Paenibacillus arenilitoris]MBD2871982.1 response regulator [Paenibacillus arenilitoris]